MPGGVVIVGGLSEHLVSLHLHLQEVLLRLPFNLLKMRQEFLHQVNVLRIRAHKDCLWSLALQFNGAKVWRVADNINYVLIPTVFASLIRFLRLEVKFFNLPSFDQRLKDTVVSGLPVL